MSIIEHPNVESQQKQFIAKKILHPWKRYFARHVDLLIGGFLGVVSLQFYLSIIAWIIPTGITKIIQRFPEIHHVLISNLYWVTIFLLLISIACTSILINAIQIALMGTTIGKHLFGIQLKNAKGRNLNFLLALHREFMAYIKGMAFGVPVISLLFQGFSYASLVKSGKTSWDKTLNCNVT